MVLVQIPGKELFPELRVMGRAVLAVVTELLDLDPDPTKALVVLLVRRLLVEQSVVPSPASLRRDRTGR